MKKNLVAVSKRFLKKNSATILTIIGAAGVVGTTIVAVKVTPKALELLEKEQEKKEEKLTVIETVKIAGPVYIPAAVIGLSTMACIIGANCVNKKTQASLASAYALMDQTYKQYRGKVIDLYGQDADSKIQEAIMKDSVVCNKPYLDISDPFFGCTDELDYFSDKGKITFYDQYSNRYFVSTAYDVRDAEYHLNRNFSQSGFCDLNEFYEFLGIDRTVYGDVAGWSMEYGYVCIDFHHRKVVMDDGMEVCVIEYLFSPEEGFENPDCNYIGE